MSDAPKATVKVLKNGPYLVSGKVPLRLETIVPDGGASWEWETGRTFDTNEPYALCRCGHSNAKPFCDGTHATIGFDGTETASHAPFAEQATTFDGSTIVLDDAEALCAVARFCDNRGRIWNLIARDGEPGVRETIVHEATRCPSGRLVVRDAATGAPIEPTFEPSIGVVEDPAEHCSGPLSLLGGVAVTAADGTAYEVRNRVTLCRCGRSANKPFCDGSHIPDFSDGLS